MRLIPLSLALLAGTALPVLAQDSTETLRQALSGMPEMLLTNPDPMQIFFLDVPVWRGLADGEVSDTALMRLNIARNIAPLEVLNYGALDIWDEKAGVPLAEISYFAGFGVPPSMVGYWGFDDASTAGDLIETLKTRDFVAVDGPAEGIFGNGEPYRQNLQGRDPANPWVGPLGRSHFVLPLGHAVIQAPAPEAMAALTQIEPSAADNVVIEVALDGLSGVVDVDQDRIVQAMVISPAFGLENLDPALLLGMQDIEAARAALEAAAQESLEGVPPYLGGIVADVQLGNRPAVIVSLAYPDCQSADKAIEGLQLRWTEHMESEAEISGRSVANAGSLCAAVVSFVGGETEDQSNLPLRETLDRFMGRNFNLLQIGMAAAQ